MTNSCNFAYSIAFDLANEGFSIVSGLATGIDAAAHSIINKSLPTIAAIGTGIDRYYPVESQRLYHQQWWLSNHRSPFWRARIIYTFY
nr:DNA-processing protein DprA [Neorickettsia helminthoeca]